MEETRIIHLLVEVTPLTWYLMKSYFMSNVLQGFDFEYNQATIHELLSSVAQSAEEEDPLKGNTDNSHCVLE